MPPFRKLGMQHTPTYPPVSAIARITSSGFPRMCLCRAAAAAYIFLPNQAASMATVSRADTGRGSTLFSVQRQLVDTLWRRVTNHVSVCQHVVFRIELHHHA